MSTLSPTDLEGFRDALHALVTELRAQIEGTREGARPVDLDEPIGRVSRMDAIQQQKMSEANRRAAQRRLAQVTGALRRLDEGRYGECADCGDPVDPARLRARPEAALCVGCQERREAAR